MASRMFDLMRSIGYGVLVTNATGNGVKHCFGLDLDKTIQLRSVSDFKHSDRVRLDLYDPFRSENLRYQYNSQILAPMDSKLGSKSLF